MSIPTRIIHIIHWVATAHPLFRNLLTSLGLIIFLSFITFCVLISQLVDSWLHLPQFPHQPLNLVISLPFLILGLLLIFWCFLNFLKAKGTPVPLNPPRTLVDTGPYAFSRNPMSTGVFITMFGLGFLYRSITLTFITTPIIILLAYWELKAIEEPELVLRLGQDYVEYRKRVSMFFPKWR